MRRPQETLSGWDLVEAQEEATIRSPQERNLLQFSAFTGFGHDEAPPSSQGRFRRVMTTVSGANGPSVLTSVTSLSLSQMSSNESDAAKGPNSHRTNAPASQRRDTETAGGRGADKMTEAGADERESAIAGWSAGSVDVLPRRRKISALRSGRRREREDGPDSEASQTSGGSALDASGGSAGEEDTFGRRHSGWGDGRLVKKVSDLLGRSAPVSPTGNAKGRTDKDSPRAKAPARKGSLLGLLGRREKTAGRKRSFLRKLEEGVAPRTHSAVEGGGRRAGAERDAVEGRAEDVVVTGVVGAETGRGSVLTEDDLAKRAVEIEMFLNSVAFL